MVDVGVLAIVAVKSFLPFPAKMNVKKSALDISVGFGARQDNVEFSKVLIDKNLVSIPHNSYTKCPINI